MLRVTITLGITTGSRLEFSNFQNGENKEKCCVFKLVIVTYNNDNANLDLVTCSLASVADTFDWLIVTLVALQVTLFWLHMSVIYDDGS